MVHAVENERADDAGGDGRIRLAKLNSRTGKKTIFFPLQFTTSRIGSLTRLVHILLKVLTIQTDRKT